MLALTYVLTALGALVVVLTRRRLGGSRVAGGHTDVGSRLVDAHSVSGALAVVVWLAFLITGGDPTIGIVGLGLWWLTAVIGVFLLMRWLPTKGRHADEVPTDRWRGGRAWSFLGHVGLVLACLYFTWAYLAL